MNGSAYDVLVVGSGPAGSLVAAELAFSGLSVAIVEARYTPDDAPRGGLIHARTRQVLARRGIVTESSGINHALYHLGGVEGALTLESPETEFGADPQYWPQASFVSSLEDICRDRGVRIFRGHRVIDIDQSSGLVDVLCQSDSGQISFRASWVVGADGARSTVRKLCGISECTSPATLSGASLLIRATSETKGIPLGWTRTQRGLLGVNRESVETTRVIWIQREKLSFSSNNLLVGYISRLLAPYTSDEDLIDIGNPSYFSDRSRLAANFRNGNVVIIGDAAHSQSPLGAQGTNLAVLDAVGLGWRLAQVVDGSSKVDELDRFLDRRRHRARHIARCTSLQSLLVPPVNSDDRVEDILNSWDLPSIAATLSGQDDPPCVSIGQLETEEVEREGFLTNCLVRGPTQQDLPLSAFLAQRSLPVHLYLHEGLAYTRRIAGSVSLRISPEGSIIP